MNRARVGHNGLFLGLVLASLGIAVAAILGVGPSFSVGSIRVSMRDATRPAVLGLLTGAIWVWYRDRDSSSLSWDRLPEWSRRLALAVAAISICVGIRWGIFVAGGADAYGYVSQAHLWATGHLTVAEPLSKLEPSLGPGVAPLGYRLATIRGSIVPTYPVGLPLMMAAASTIAGPTAMYLVVPVLGGVAVWLTFLLGTRIAGPRAGVIAATLFACSPIFLLQLLEPMSDVPVTAWWLASLFLALDEDDWTAFLAGGAAAVALLTRPNLLPLAILTGCFTLKRHQARRALFYVIGVVPGCIAIALVNRSLYGSVTGTGYGPVDALFRVSNLGANIQHYSTWLYQLHSPFIFVGLLSPLLIAGVVGRYRPDKTFPSARAVWVLLSFSGALFACYAFYIPYDTWPFARFLLPAVPLLLILSSAVATAVASRLPPRTRGAVTVMMFGLLACWSVKKAYELHVFQVQGSEQRYRVIGEYIDRELPSNSVVISVIESGSVRLYGHRATLRWDMLEPTQFENALGILRQSGYVPYLLIEEQEESDFRGRFADATKYGHLNWRPMAEYRGYTRVLIYSLREPLDQPGSGEVVSIPGSTVARAEGRLDERP